MLAGVCIALDWGALDSPQNRTQGSRLPGFCPLFAPLCALLPAVLPFRFALLFALLPTIASAVSALAQSDLQLILLFDILRCGDSADLRIGCGYGEMGRQVAKISGASAWAPCLLPAKMCFAHATGHRFDYGGCRDRRRQ